MVVNKIYDITNLQQSHLVCLNWLPKNVRVLEFGPATGYMSRAMRDSLGCRVTGFEYSPEAAEQASQYCEQIVIGDIEDSQNWTGLRPPYDAVLFVDVLEHLRDPHTVLANCRSLLSSGGRLLISVPNIAHWTIRRNILRGQFDYTKYGILDNTHLKFFTRKTLVEMVEKAGFLVEEITFSKMNYPGDAIFQRLRLMRLKGKINLLFDKVLPDAAAYQFFVNCRLNPVFSAPVNTPLYEMEGA